jgi:type III pantothenate kinase
MLLTVDVGNTQTTLALFSDQEMAANWRMATDVSKTGDEIAALVNQLLELAGSPATQ